VRGVTVMREYLDNPAATAAARTDDGWLRTGDLARIDEGGFVTLLGRRRDLIIRGGEKIFPEEVEEALLAHPAVAEAAVVGLSDPSYGEVPAAFVVLAAGNPVDPGALVAWCRDRLASFKVPRAVHFLDALPRNPNGKVRKPVLREHLAERPAAEPRP
jgi:acyl-CoA synthetase (AMP-forming)/AMP-acid ligase II